MRPDKQIKIGGEALKKIMQVHLVEISKNIIKKLMINHRKNKTNAVKNINPSGKTFYKDDLKKAVSVIAKKALDEAKKEIPKVLDYKFSEFEKLPPKIRKRILQANELLINTQVADLEKAIYFQYNSSVASGLSESEIAYLVSEKAGSYIESNSISAGAFLSSANMVNEVRNAFFFDDKVLESIDAFQFVNGDPVTDICSDLDGLIFSKNDPNAFKYTPPLHYNCKSYIQPIVNLKKGQKIEKLRPSTNELDDQIQFSEVKEACTCYKIKF